MRFGMRGGVCILLLAAGCARPDSSVRDAGIGGTQTRIDSLVRLADSTYRQDRREAVRLWTAALDEAALTGDSFNIARAWTGLGMAARPAGNWEESRRLGEQALALKLRLRMSPGELFRSQNALGLLAWTEERLADATTYLTNARASAQDAGDLRAMGVVSINLGLVAKDLGAFEESRRSLMEGRRIATSAADSVTLGRALNNLGMLDIALGEPLSAIAWLEDARRVARAVADTATEVNARGQLATAYSALGEGQRAFALLDSALAMAIRLEQPQEVAENLLLTADLFFEAGDHQHALDYYERALAANDSLGLPEERGDILRSRARAQAALGNLPAAVDLAREALRIHREGGFQHPEFEDLLVLANLTQRSQRPGEAEAHLRAAERLAIDLQAPIAQAMVAIAVADVAAQRGQWTRVLESIERARPTMYLAGSVAEAEALTMQARALAELGQHEAALSAGRLAIDAVERMRASYGTNALRASYTSEKAGIFARQAMLLLRMGRIDEALQVADAARGRVLLENLTQARSDIGAGSFTGSVLEREALLRRIDALVAQLREREQTPPRERSSDFVTANSSLRDSVDFLRAEYTALLARSGNRRSSNGIVEFANIRPSVMDVVGILSPDELLLEYLVTDDRLIIFAATNMGITAYEADESAQSLSSRVQLARDLLQRRGAEAEAHGVLSALYNIVLGPVVRAGALKPGASLIVVPHHVLTYLPFAALVNPATARYVAQDHVILNVPTSAVLPVLRRGAPANGGGRMRSEIFAPLRYDLPGTLAEARSVATAVRGSITRTGRTATEARLRTALTRGGIVHVATHARLNMRNPLFSHVELSPGARGEADNGRLEVHELLASNLNAALVFLSGCETAVGRSWVTQFDTGEDYATLGQAFLLSGAKNVVATLWRIDDDGAAEFARQFYGGLKGKTYAEAIAQAQRMMLRDPRYRSPYFWAAYQIMGGGGANRVVASDKR